MSNVNIIQEEIARATSGTILKQTPADNLTPIGTPTPPFSRSYSPIVLRPLLRPGVSVSDQGRKEYLNLTPLNQGVQAAIEQAITGYSGTSPSIAYLNPFTGQYTQGANADIPIEDMPYNFVKEDNLTITGYSFANWANGLTFNWTPDSTRYIYKIVVNIPILQYVSMYASGTAAITNFKMTIVNSQTNQNIISSINIPISFNPLTGNGLTVLFVRGVITFPLILSQKVLFGQPVTITISLNGTNAVATPSVCGIADMMPEQITNNTRRFYPACIGFHTYAGPDHLDNVINESTYNNRWNIDGAQYAG